ncbi:MAG TPA: hypothetical protein PLV51_06830 [Lentimicrobium sp.]|nr:hypothetical protein [Lentimicrobium sp.]
MNEFDSYFRPAASDLNNTPGLIITQLKIAGMQILLKKINTFAPRFGRRLRDAFVLVILSV